MKRKTLPVFFRGGVGVTLSVLVLILSLLATNAPLSDSIDLSAEGVTQLSDSTTDCLQNLQDHVDLLLCDARYDLRLTELLSRYDSASPHISFRQIDKEATAYYAGTPLSEGSVIVTSGEFDVILPYESFFEVVYGGDSSVQTIENIRFLGQNRINSAIEGVCAEWPLAYVISGHQEALLGPAFVQTMQGQGYHTQTLYLQETGVVPSDCSLLLLNVPQVDITDTEAAALIDWLSQGGSLYVATDARYGAMPNLDSVLAYCGMEVLEGVVLEADPAHMLSSEYPQFLLAESLLDPEQTQPVLMGVAQAIAPTGFGAYTTNAVLASSSLAYRKPHILTDGITALAPEDEQGVFALAMLAQAESGSKVFCLGTSQCFADELNDLSGKANYAVASEILAQLRFEPFASNCPLVPSPQILPSAVHLSQMQYILLSALGIILPILTLLGGLLVRRKRYSQHSPKIDA